MIPKSEHKAKNGENLDIKMDSLTSSYFKIQLTASQAEAITNILPRGYSMKKDEQKNVSSKSKSKKMRNPIIVEEEKDKFIREKCFEILNNLKNSRHAWPFLNPVNPEQLGILHYFQIIKNPMDLMTIEQKLKQGKYLTALSFFEDIQLIINNSNAFNQDNAEFIKITDKFEKCYLSETKKIPSYLLTEKMFPNLQEKLQIKNKQNEGEIKSFGRKLTEAQNKTNNYSTIKLVVPSSRKN